jgi:hypothetical protein
MTLAIFFISNLYVADGMYAHAGQQHRRYRHLPLP